MPELYVYIPGFGMWLNPGRKLLLRLCWRGRKVVLFDSRWSDQSETAADKKSRLAELVRQQRAGSVVYIGESAGGSLAVVSALEHPDARFVTVCGFNHGQAAVDKQHAEQHPAFYELVGELDRRLGDIPPSMAQRSLTAYSTGDKLVKPEHSRIAGVPHKSVGRLKHNLANIKCLMNPRLLGL